MKADLSDDGPGLQVLYCLGDPHGGDAVKGIKDLMEVVVPRDVAHERRSRRQFAASPGDGGVTVAHPPFTGRQENLRGMILSDGAR